MRSPLSRRTGICTEISRYVEVRMEYISSSRSMRRAACSKYRLTAWNAVSPSLVMGQMLPGLGRRCWEVERVRGDRRGVLLRLEVTRRRVAQELGSLC